MSFLIPSLLYLDMLCYSSAISYNQFSSVTVCPSTKTEWESKVANSSCSIPFSYHCAPIRNGRLIEICMRPRLITNTVLCPWIDFSDRRRSLPSFNFKTCQNEELGCPKHQSYYTDELYKFPACFGEVKYALFSSTRTSAHVKRAEARAKKIVAEEGVSEFIGNNDIENFSTRLQVQGTPITHSNRTSTESVNVASKLPTQIPILLPVVGGFLVLFVGNVLFCGITVWRKRRRGKETISIPETSNVYDDIDIAESPNIPQDQESLDSYLEPVAVPGSLIHRPCSQTSGSDTSGKESEKGEVKSENESGSAHISIDALKKREYQKLDVFQVEVVKDDPADRDYTKLDPESKNVIAGAENA